MQRSGVISPKAVNKSIITEVCKNLKMPIKTKVHVLNKTKMIIGYEVLLHPDGNLDLMLITSRSSMDDGQIFE